MKKLLCIILIITMSLSSGCVEKKQKPSTSRKYLVYNLGELPSDLLMLEEDNVRQKDLLLALFEGLVREDKNGEIVPAMAESFDLTEDKIQYTFKLRENIHDSQGKPINAIDFERFFHDILLERDNMFTEQLYCIFGAKDFSEGKIGFNKVAITAKDDRTLQIRLNSPNNYFINILSNPVFTLRKNNINIKNWIKDYKQIQYTGPFKIESIYEDKEILLVKNEEYWRKNQIVSKELLITSIKDEEKALANFETTEYIDTSKIDVFVSPPISEAISLSDEKKTFAVPTQSMYYLNFNLKGKEVIMNENFRNAINSILSKEFIIQSISKDLAVPAVNYIPFTTNDINGGKVIFNAFGNKEKGLDSLNKTDYLKKGEELIVVYENKNFDTRLCKEITNNIREYLGINIICKGYKKDELKDVLDQGKYDMIFSKFDENSGDIYNFLTRWTSNSTHNVYGYKNIDFDKIIGKAISEKDNTKKINFYNEAQEILAKDLPSIPIFIVNTVICKKENVKDIYVTKRGNLIFDYAYKEDAIEQK